MGEFARRICCYWRKQTLGATLGWFGRTVPPADPRVDRRRTRLIPHPTLRTRAEEPRAPAGVRTPTSRDDIRVARPSHVGRVVAAPRGLCTARASRT